MRNKPDIMYFQICDDSDYIEEDFDDFDKLILQGISFSTEQINNCDLEYYSKEFILKFLKYCCKYLGKRILNTTDEISDEKLFEDFKLEYYHKFPKNLLEE